MPNPRALRQIGETNYEKDLIYGSVIDDFLCS